MAGRATSYWTPEARYDAKGRALLQRAAASGQYPLSSCRESRQRSTPVSEKIRLCSSRVGLTDSPEAPLLGELANEVRLRGCTKTEPDREPLLDSTSPSRLTPCHLPYRGEALAVPQSERFRQRLSLWGQRRRPPPVAETGRSCWGSGQQDASGSEADAGSRNPALASGARLRGQAPLPRAAAQR